MAKRKRWYTVSAECTVSVYTDVLASSPEEAKQLAEDRPMVAIHESGEDRTQEWVTSGELDGTPRNLRADRCKKP